MIEFAIPPRRRDLGGGFEVGRVLSWTMRRMFGPFTFFDRIEQAKSDWQARRFALPTGDADEFIPPPSE